MLAQECDPRAWAPNGAGDIQTLGKGQVLRVRRAAGRVVDVVRGRIWLTQESVPDDAFPAAGESVEARGRGLLVIEALEDAQVRVRAGRAPLPRLLAGSAAALGRLRARLPRLVAPGSATR